MRFDRYSNPKQLFATAMFRGLRQHAKWACHVTVAALCKLTLVLAILPSLAESTMNRAEGSEPLKAEMECEFGCPVEHSKRSISVEHSCSGKILHPTHLVVVRFEQQSSAQAHGHFLHNGLCAPRLC